MKLTEIVQNREIILVCGNIACGKGTYCTKKYPGFAHITVSDIVKQLSKQTERSELGKTAYLDLKIIQALIEKINQHDKVVVDGIRQVSILHALENHYQQQIKKVIWLDVPEDVRKQRFAGRKDRKDNLDYDVAMASDRQLGIGDVESYIRGKHTVEPY
jgi:predicted kinase